MLWPESNYSYYALTHLEAGDMFAALREWLAGCIEEGDRVRVQRLLRKVESSIDIVVVERHPSKAGEMRGTSILPGAARRVGDSSAMTLDVDADVKHGDEERTEDH